MAQNALTQWILSYPRHRYHKCPEKPTVQTFHIADHDHEKQTHLPGISTVLLTGLKYLLGGFAILALPFIVLKALFLPLKFFLFLKAFTLVKSFFLFSLFLRFLRLNRRFALNNNLNNNNNNNGFFGLPGKHKDKLQTIKDILNSEDMADDDVDYKTDDEDVISKEDVGSPMLIDNPFNTTEVNEEFVQNLVKLIKLKNKKW